MGGVAKKFPAPADKYGFRILIETELGNKVSYVSHYPAGYSAQSHLGASSTPGYAHGHVTQSFTPIYTKGQMSSSLQDNPIMETFEAVQTIQSMVSCSFVNAPSQSDANLSLKQYHYFGGNPYINCESHKGGFRTGSIRFVERPIHYYEENEHSQSLRLYYSFQDRATQQDWTRTNMHHSASGFRSRPSMSYDWSGNNYNMLFQGHFNATSSYANDYSTSSLHPGEWIAWHVSGSDGAYNHPNNFMSMSYTGSANSPTTHNLFGSGSGIITGSWSGSMGQKVHPWGAFDNNETSGGANRWYENDYPFNGVRSLGHDKFDTAIRVGDGKGNPFTVQFWMNRQGIRPAGVFGEQCQSSSFWFGNNDDTAHLTLSGSNGTIHTFTNTNEFTTQEWNLITLRRIGTGGSTRLLLSVNDNDATEGTNDGTDAVNDLHIGNLGRAYYQAAGISGNAQRPHFYGALSDFKVWNRSISVEEIKNTYNAALGKPPHKITDKLLRYKFFGKQVCRTLGLPEGQWIYTDKFRLSNNRNFKTQLGGTIEADYLSIRRGLQLSSVADVNSDLSFRVTNESSRLIKFTDYDRKVPRDDVIFGYDIDKEHYVLQGDQGAGLYISASGFKGDGSQLTNVGGGGSGEWEGSGTTVRLADSGDKVVIGANNPPAEDDAHLTVDGFISASGRVYGQSFVGGGGNNPPTFQMMFGEESMSFGSASTPGGVGGISYAAPPLTIFKNGARVAIGSRTAPKKLTVKGTISASGDLFVGSDNGAFVSASTGTLEISGSGEGDIDIAGTYYGYQYHMVDFYNAIDANGEQFLGLGSVSDLAARRYYHSFIAPFSGSLEKVIFQTELDSGDTDVKFYVRRHALAPNGESPGTGTGSSDANSLDCDTPGRSYTFPFTSNNTFSTGDEMYISVDPTNNMGDVTGQVIFKYKVED